MVGGPDGAAARLGLKRTTQPWGQIDRTHTDGKMNFNQIQFELNKRFSQGTADPSGDTCDPVNGGHQKSGQRKCGFEDSRRTNNEARSKPGFRHFPSPVSKIQLVAGEEVKAEAVVSRSSARQGCRNLSPVDGASRQCGLRRVNSPS